MTFPNDLEPIELSAERLTRWWQAAEQLGAVGLGLRTELMDVARDPTRHMLRRAARAARYAEQHVAGVEKQIANAVATEIEDAAEAG